MILQAGFEDQQVVMIRDNFPLAYKALGDYYHAMIEQQVKNEEARKIYQEYAQSILAEPQHAILKAYCRMLYDFFDSHGIHVYVDQYNLEDPDVLTTKILDSKCLMGLFPDDLKIENRSRRVLAELSAFYGAFGHLQRRLANPEIFNRKNHIVP